MKINTKLMSKINTGNAAAQTMMLNTSTWAGMTSFAMFPVSNDCPYVECLYNPAAKTLAIIGKNKKDTFHMVPRLDNNGHPEKLKVGATPENPHKKQRVTQESYSEYYITDKTEVEAFIKLFAINHEEFDYKKSLDMELMDNPSPILTGPQIEKGEGKIITMDS